jgi:hypothetical protein
MSDERVSYVLQYGGRCRDCADEDGVCPYSGLPCAGAEKAVRFVLGVLDYGYSHGFLKAAPAPAISGGTEGLQDAHVIHANMLRGTIAKLTPAQIGHLYRGEEAAAVIAEVTRQNPDAAPAVSGGEMQEALRDAWSVLVRLATELDGVTELRDEVAAIDRVRGKIDAALAAADRSGAPAPNELAFILRDAGATIRKPDTAPAPNIHAEGKRARLKLHLDADSGYEAREEHRISSSQWADILGICAGSPALAPAISSGVARAIELMRLAADILREHAPDAEVFYDEADCDGSCLADDLTLAANSPQKNPASNAGSRCRR